MEFAADHVGRCAGHALLSGRFIFPKNGLPVLAGLDTGPQVCPVHASRFGDSLQNIQIVEIGIRLPVRRSGQVVGVVSIGRFTNFQAPAGWAIAMDEFTLWMVNQLKAGEQILAGSVPAWVRRLTPVTLRTAQATATIHVIPDYIAIGS